VISEPTALNLLNLGSFLERYETDVQFTGYKLKNSMSEISFSYFLALSYGSLLSGLLNPTN